MMRFQTFRLGPPPAQRGLGAMLAWIVGVIAGGVALLLGAIFAVFTALAVAVLAVFAAIMVFAARLMRGRAPARRPASAQSAAGADGAVIDAHKVGDQWVAYGFDQPTR